MTKTVVVGIVGLGYVGLTTAVCLASKGIPTIGIDVDKKKLAGIARGEPPFAEKGLSAILSKSLTAKKLVVTSDYEALAKTDINFITVGTPSGDEGSIDLTQVKRATESIAGAIRRSGRHAMVVVKSTVTPGTTENLVKPTLEAHSGMKLGEFLLASNPEFLREGSAVRDTMHPDRLIIGTLDAASERAIVSFYKMFYQKLPPTVRTTPSNAELVKYASNSFLATKLTFVNEIANLCARLPGADVSVIARGMGLDKRIGEGFLRAGLGYGGSCFPKDVSAFLKFAGGLGMNLGVVRSAAEGNEKQPEVAVKLAEELAGSLEGKRVAVLGLAFKPESDDMREAVSLKLIPQLLGKGTAVVVYDPEAMDKARALLGDRVEYAKSVPDCLKGADCCILVTEWEEFSRVSPRTFMKLMRTPAVVDGRRVLDPAKFQRAGVKFAAIGLSSQVAGSGT